MQADGTLMNSGFNEIISFAEVTSQTDEQYVNPILLAYSLSSLCCSKLNSKYENPFLFQERKSQNSGNYMGLGYPGSAISSNIKDPRILLDTDSLESSRYLDYFKPDGCADSNNCAF